MTSCTETLARHVIGLRHEDIPSEVRGQAVRHIIDTIGAGIHGATTRQGAAIFEVAHGRYRAEGARVWGRPDSLDAAGAALVNAAQAHAFELDDYLAAGKTHPGTVIVPAALAVAPPTATGEELVTAIVAAYDVMCRAALAMNPNSTRGRGFHITGLTGPFGAAAVAGRLLGLDEAQLASALGVAASCSSGIFAFTAEGAMTKPFHAGRAAEAGIVAAGLARRGFEGPLTAFEAPDGGLLKAVSDDPRPEELTRDLGTRFDLANVAIKPYPCCGSAHSSIDAILTLRERDAITAANVDSITVHNARGVLLQCGFEYTAAGGPVEAQMSLQYCLAAALVDGQVGLKQFDEDRRRDPELLEIARRITFELDPEIDRIYPTSFPAHVSVGLATGGTLDIRVPAPLGSPANSLDTDGVRAKFSDVTAALLDPKTQSTLLDRLEQLDSLRAVDLTGTAPTLTTAATDSALAVDSRP